MRTKLATLLVIPMFLCVLCTKGRAASIYSQTNLVSDLPGVAAHQDPNLVNPWGISFSGTSPFWIADNGTGVATLYNGAGVPNALVATIPPPSGGTPPSAPTGTVFNSTAGFGGSHFLFDTEDGTIAAWTSGSTAVREADNSSSGAVYKGLALDNNGQDLLYAANFHNGTIDVFTSSFAPTTVPGGFTDPTLPAGYAPFDIQNIGGLLYVTYAKQDQAKHDDVSGPGNGYVDVFNANGVLQTRLISNGPLNSPWGIALAPANFGTFSNDLLVGNFGDGTINAFNPVTGAFLGTLSGLSGNPIVNQGLWAIQFGNGAQGTSTNTLYLTAGIPGPDAVEDHGLFAEIQAVPEPGTITLLIATVLVGLAFLRKSPSERAANRDL